jgi:hypothetical protein
MEDARARRWLARHGAADREVTPLLAARLAARRRGEILTMVVLVAGIVAYLAWGVWESVVDYFTPSVPEVTDLSRLAALFIVYALGAIAAQFVQARGERRIGAALSRRVAQPTAAGPVAVAGSWFAAAAAVVYGGGLLAGAVVALGGRDASDGDRLIGVVFIGAVLAFAALGLGALAGVVRRPVVAEDAQSLVDDHLLRREEAMQAIAPYPAILAVVAGVNAYSDLALFVLVGYGLAAFATWLLAHAATTAATPQAVMGRAS